ncbi:MAG TPA: hypothetical protein V6D43_01100 [Candidatus Sericytochromatia bacterium]
MKSLYKTMMSRQSGVESNPSLRSITLPPLGRLCASQLVLAGLMAIAIPIRPAAAYTEFQICAAELVRFASVAPELASVACGQALRPEDYSRCVVTISLRTPAATQEALQACTRVRRPVELSRCVVDITDRTRDSEVPSVLSYCRRSLLPIRFSECVTGLTREVDFATPRALDACIAAEDFPRQLFPNPNFVPPASSQPTLPTVPNVLPNLTPTPIIPPSDTPVNPVRF